MHDSRRHRHVFAIITGMAAIIGLTLSAAEASPRSAHSYRTAADSAIDQRYSAEPALRQLLGPAIAAETTDGAVHYRTYQYGNLYYTPATGVHEVHGSILSAYYREGHYQKFGVPTTDEQPCADPAGRHNIFQLATATGAVTTSGFYWRSDTGAHSIVGAVFTKWAAAGYEWGLYGYPTSDTYSTATGATFNHFLGNDDAGASIYVTAPAGANGVKGRIRDRWISVGGEYSYLGYPESDEFAVTGGKRSNFHGGYIVWTAQSGQTAVYRY